MASSEAQTQYLERGNSESLLNSASHTRTSFSSVRRQWKINIGSTFPRILGVKPFSEENNNHLTMRNMQSNIILMITERVLNPCF